jgi:hypothetical protein
VLAPQQAESVLERIWAIESVADVNALTAMLEVSRRFEAAA